MDNKEKNILHYLGLFFRRRFNLHLDKGNEEDVISAIRSNTAFVGPSLWILIFAIFIASIGLNVNSTAVIIGAMLISPLMGPIIGIGLGIGINDLQLVRQGGRNLLIATLISIATSTLYFYITPLHDAQSELLARTTPTVWDVFIAFLGGLAGAIAVTRKEKTNVVPGVAIATALMPPLCTAGYGLASGNLLYFAGALYLFFINSLFICISTYLIIRLLRFNKKYFEDSAREKRVSRYILISVLVTIIPSIYLAYGIVQKSLFENNAQKFVREIFNSNSTQVVNKTFRYSKSEKEIDLLLIGEEIPRARIDSIRRLLPGFKLAGTKLRIRQGLDARSRVDLSQIKASIMEDVFAKTASKDTSGSSLPDTIGQFSLAQEIAILFPAIKDYSLGKAVLSKVDTLKSDSTLLFAASLKSKMTAQERDKLARWLRLKTGSEKLRVIIE